MPVRILNSFPIALAVVACVSILYLLWSDKGFREERERARLEDKERKAKLKAHKQRDRQNK